MQKYVFGTTYTDTEDIVHPSLKILLSNHCIHCSFIDYMGAVDYIDKHPRGGGVCVCGRGGRGGGQGWLLPIYDIVRICVPNGPLFQRCQVYDCPPFFNKKYMTDPIFHYSYVKRPHCSDIKVNAYMFWLRDLSRLFVLMVFNELTATFV